MTQRVGLLMEKACLVMWRVGLWISRGLGSKITMSWTMAAGKLCYCRCSLIGLSILLESLADTGSWAGKLCYC